MGAMTQDIMADVSNGFKTSVQRLFCSIPNLSVGSTGEVEMTLGDTATTSSEQPLAQGIPKSSSTVSNKSTSHAAESVPQKDSALAGVMSWTDLPHRASLTTAESYPQTNKASSRNIDVGVMSWSDM
mmetsp:Transcript_18130/g.32364  ORF Transcript_18130/g.32364 Transcript_18130/m.32364 type:complete len:127 (+) Transcript_18130:2-382(+)